MSIPASWETSRSCVCAFEGRNFLRGVFVFIDILKPLVGGKETSFKNQRLRVNINSRESWSFHVEFGSWRGKGRQTFLVLLRRPDDPSKERSQRLEPALAMPYPYCARPMAGTGKSNGPPVCVKLRKGHSVRRRESSSSNGKSHFRRDAFG